MPQLIIQPAGNQGGREHYRDTVETPVPLERIEPLVSEEKRAELQALFSNQSAAAVWGVTPGADGGNERKWQRISAGDAAVFLKEGRAYAVGTVATTAHSPALAQQLWGASDRGETWEYVYFLKDVHDVDVTYEELNALLGYEPANRFQGFAVVNDERSVAALGRLGVSVPPSQLRRYWWVNQGTTYAEESAGGFVWAPTTNRNGHALYHYTNVSRLRPQDVIVHYANGTIRAVSAVTEAPAKTQRPETHGGPGWNDDGFLTRTRYQPVDPPVPLADVPLAWRQKESEADTSPFTRDASVKLGYLFPLTPDFARRLLQLLERRGVVEGDVVQQPVTTTDLVARANTDFERAGLLFDEEFVRRFVAALIAKPFVILTGMSGSGKTKLAQAFATWLGCTTESGRSKIVAVGPDWTSKESALGYANALDPDAYARTPALDLILAAALAPDRAHFLILDEMNLSHVERYFADILSAMESGEYIHLHAGPQDRQGVPSDVKWPRNLFLIGTVNVDETTYMFSPKVLDRAHVLEFRSDSKHLSAVLRETRRPDLSLVAGLGAEFERLVADRGLTPLPESDQKKLERELQLLFDVLSRQGYEFGYRTAIEVSEFVRSYRGLGGAWQFDVAMDVEILQKLLPRIHGSQRQIEGVLRAMAETCFARREWVEGAQLANGPTIREQAGEAADMTNREFDPLKSERYKGQAFYPRSFEKIIRMLRQLDRAGFTSFAEA